MRVSFSRLGDVMECQREDHDDLRGQLKYQPLEPSCTPPQIRLDHLTFSYRADDEAPLAINELSLDIAPGETVGLAGPSGSGKTTLIKMIPLLIRPDSGKVIFNGHDAATIPVARLRQMICFLPQQASLFSGTIWEALTVGCPDVPPTRVMQVCKGVGAEEVINGLKNGYKTVLDERGGGLSGGQRQRIALARALIGQAPILLFDEATSALDEMSEQQIFEALPTLLNGRTLIAVSHRSEMLKMLDRVVLLEEGRLIADEYSDRIDQLRAGRLNEQNIQAASL